MLKVEDAKKELSQKSYRDIQTETAWKWASRAAASYENVVTSTPEHMMALWTIAVEYHHEAIEHAALVEADAPTLLEEVQKALRGYSTPAAAMISTTLNQEM